MVQIELEGDLILEVPLKSHMKAHDFLQVVEKLERLNTRSTKVDLFDIDIPAHNPSPPVSSPHQEPLAAPQQITQEDFKLPSEDLIKVQHLANQVRSHMDYIKRHEDAISRHDKHLSEILEYLQTLDKHLRR